jgi:hypothetical protein
VWGGEGYKRGNVRGETKKKKGANLFGFCLAQETTRKGKRAIRIITVMTSVYSSWKGTSAIVWRKKNGRGKRGRKKEREKGNGQHGSSFVEVK